MSRTSKDSNLMYNLPTFIAQQKVFRYDNKNPENASPFSLPSQDKTARIPGSIKINLGFNDNESSSTVWKERHRYSHCDSSANNKPCYPPFRQPSIISRPKYFTEEWMQQDLKCNCDEVKRYATEAFRACGSKRGTKGERLEVGSIVQSKEGLLVISKPLSSVMAPPSSAKVQWRVSRYQRVPSFYLLFLLLNRYATVVALIKLSSTSALCVFESMEGALRAIAPTAPLQASKLFIINWWYPKYAHVETRAAVKHGEQAVSRWLLYVCDNLDSDNAPCSNDKAAMSKYQRFMEERRSVLFGTMLPKHKPGLPIGLYTWRDSKKPFRELRASTDQLAKPKRRRPIQAWLDKPWFEAESFSKPFCAVEPMRNSALGPTLAENLAHVFRFSVKA